MTLDTPGAVAYPRRVVHRLVAALSAAALVVGVLLVGWHQATVIHGVCVEHGGELHLDKVADHDHAQDDPTSRLERSAWILGDGDHDCTILATASAALVAPGAPSPVLAHEDAAPALPAARADAAVVAIYRLAPKTSPPV